MTALLVAVFKSQGGAFLALHLTAQFQGLEVLEIIPLGSQAQLLVKGPSETLKGYRRQLSSQDMESCLQIENWDLRIEKAFYSLEHSPLQGSLLFVENESLGRLLRSAQRALELGMQIVDVKIPRGSVKWGVLTLTASQVPAGFVEELRKENVVNLIETPSVELKKYFEIEA